jgi:hypothetical protein
LSKIFNITLYPGQTGGFSPNARDQDLPFSTKDEPATLPRVKEFVIITDLSPWCTIVKNERGVTMGDICQTIWKELVLSVCELKPPVFTPDSYTDNFVTEAEFNALPPRLQDQIRRVASHNAQSAWNGMYYSPGQVNPNRFRRVGACWSFIGFMALSLSPLLM